MCVYESKREGGGERERERERFVCESQQHSTVEEEVELSSGGTVIPCREKNL